MCGLVNWPRSTWSHWVDWGVKPQHKQTNYVVEIITKTYLYNFDPLKPHFYIVKLEFAGVNIIFLISAQNIDCGYLLKLPLWGSSNEYPQSKFWAEKRKISEFSSENFQFFVVKFSIYLNRPAFVMICAARATVTEHSLPVTSRGRVNKLWWTACKPTKS